MKNFLASFAALTLSVFCSFGQPIVPSTPYTRGLLRSADAPTARAVLGVSGTGVLSGPLTIFGAPFAGPSSFTLQGTQGPTILDFLPSFIGSNLTFFGGDAGMLFADKPGAIYQMSIGEDWKLGLSEPHRTRFYDAQDNAQSYTFNDVAKGDAGTATSIYAPLVGGNAAMMQGLPVHGGELAQRMPTSMILVDTSGSLAGGARPVTNNCTQFWVTNMLTMGWRAGLYSNVVTAGGAVEMNFSIGTMCEFRNPDGSLRWNTNMFPDGPVWMANWLHTNMSQNVLGCIQLYYNPSWSNSTPTGLVINDGGGYLAPVMTADRVSKDVATIADWGFDAVLASDMTTFVSVESRGYRHAINRQIAEEILWPHGLTPRDQPGGPARPMHMESFQDVRGFPDATTAYEVSVMRDGNWPGSGPIVSPVAGANAMQGARMTWTNMAWMAGKGHYISEVQLPLGRTWNTNNAYNITRADGQFWMGMGAMYPSYLWQLDSWDDAPLTNAVTTNVVMNAGALSLYFDSAYAPGFPVLDQGSNNISIWLKPLAGGNDYALVMANETGSSAPLTFNWATNLASPASFHAVNSPLYPVLVPTNAAYVFTDVFNGNTNSAVLSGSFTATVTNHSCLVFRVTRVLASVAAAQSWAGQNQFTNGVAGAPALKVGPNANAAAWETFGGDRVGVGYNGTGLTLATAVGGKPLQYGTATMSDLSGFLPMFQVDTAGNGIFNGTTTATNGFRLPQASAFPTAAVIGGVVGSVTNHMLVNKGGILYDCWSDGTTAYTPKALSP
jgi:hypothetical protein